MKFPRHITLEVLEDLVRHKHHPTVYLWGGEPMLYEGTLELIERATALGLPTAIATNGTRISPRATHAWCRPPCFPSCRFPSTAPMPSCITRPVRPWGEPITADIQAGLAAVHEARRAQGRHLPLIASLTTISRNNYRHLVDIYEAFRDRVDLFIFYLAWWIDGPGVRPTKRISPGALASAPYVRRVGWAAGNLRTTGS